MIGNSCTVGCSNVQHASCSAEFICTCVPGYSYDNGTCQSGKSCLEYPDENVHMQLTLVVSNMDNSIKYLRLIM